MADWSHQIAWVPVAHINIVSFVVLLDFYMRKFLTCIRHYFAFDKEISISCLLNKAQFEPAKIYRVSNNVRILCIHLYLTFCTLETQFVSDLFENHIVGCLFFFSFFFSVCYTVYKCNDTIFIMQYTTTNHV